MRFACILKKNHLKSFLKFIIFLFLFVVLTAITQIGGLVLLLGIFISKFWKTEFKFKKSVLFIFFYLLTTLFVVPIIAPFFGREKIQNTTKIKPTNYMTILLNRNYVCAELNQLLAKTQQDLDGTAIEIRYLDANFPFLNKFPLLPHLSHNDGKKLDLSLVYQTKDGRISTKQKSVSGYGVFEVPKANEYNQINACFKKGFFQYDYSKYMTFGKINKDLIFSEKGTKKLIKSLLKNKALGKLFIEPHLKHRLKVSNPKIRYHGCSAVRHDDHIHIQT